VQLEVEMFSADTLTEMTSTTTESRLYGIMQAFIWIIAMMMMYTAIRGLFRQNVT